MCHATLSSLGAQLFLIQVNNIPSAISCKMLLYADNTVLVALGAGSKVTQDTLSLEMASISEWLIDNNLRKLESILFSFKWKLHKHNTIQVHCAGNKLTCHTHVKYLAAKLYRSLSRNGMAGNLFSKSNTWLKFLHQHVKNVTLETKNLLVLSFIQASFGCASTCCTQNKFIWFLLNASAWTHIETEEFCSRITCTTTKAKFSVQNVKCSELFITITQLNM